MDVSARLPNEILLLSDPAESRSKASSLAGSIAAFLPKYAWLYGSHAYDAVKENFFANNWPKDWTFLTEDAHYSVDDLIGIAKGEVCETWPETLKSFVKTSRELSLPREVLDEEFGEVLSDIQQSYDV
ncbi:hypothetical protein BC829DRAFT_129404 [Chytridium lagenaria]|nr:hypothetical protein BC829DRAFT_129404 [Chytridium lagenaria]